MNALKNYKLIDSDDVISNIQKTVIKKLKNDFNEMNLDIIEINNMGKIIKKISMINDDDKKLKRLEFFLLDNYQYFVKDNKSPLNTFYFNCGIVYKKFFLAN